MANLSLLNQTTFIEIIKLGFVKIEDDSGDPIDTFYTMKNDKFKIIIDCAMDITLERINPDTESIKVEIDDLYDLRNLIAFIQD